MNTTLKIVSLIALLATILPSLLYFTGTLEHSLVLAFALIGSAGWFVATPMWMGRKQPADAEHAEA